MKGYQAGIAEGKIDAEDTQVFGVSVDSFVANNVFAEKEGIEFPLLSDFTRKVSKEYGVLHEEQQFSRRTTFVIDKKGVIQYIEEGNTAVDPNGAIVMCVDLKEKEKGSQ